MNNFQKFFKHLHTIGKHRRIVRKWCFKMGIPWRGLVHDLSKYSPTELAIYKYYDGSRSPHDIARNDLGYSPSWYHHKHKNKHHWEYWVDDYAHKTAVKIPYKYVIEMFCDFVGAGKVYKKGLWNPGMPLKYHLSCKYLRIFHKKSCELLEELLEKLKALGEDDFIFWYKQNKKLLKKKYNSDADTINF